MPSVEDEISEISTDWDVNYLDNESDGDNRYVIVVEKEDVRIKVYIPEDYPDKCPSFEFDEKEMKDVNEEMQRHILETIHKRIAQGIVSNPIIKSSLEDVWKQIKCSADGDNIKQDNSYKVKPTASQRKKKKKTKYVMAAQFGILPNLSPGHEVLSKQNSPKKEANIAQKPTSPEVRNTTKMKKSKEKAPPMKTARDVINRLKWDDQLKKDEFTIGYEDRFCGIIEAPVFDLNWDDNIASTGPNDKLAIPEHRIQYFKWNDVIVWEKITRKDFVFGSTDTKTDIVEFIKRWKQCQKQELPAISNDGIEAPTENTGNSVEGAIVEQTEDHLTPNVHNSEIALAMNKNDILETDELPLNKEVVPSPPKEEEYKQLVEPSPLLMKPGQEKYSVKEIPLPNDTDQLIARTVIPCEVISTVEEIPATVEKMDLSGNANFNDEIEALKNDWGEMAFGGTWGEVDGETEQNTTDKDVDFPGVTSCPKSQKQSRHYQKDHPYHNTQNNSKRQHDRDYGNRNNWDDHSRDRKGNRRDKRNDNRRSNDDSQAFYESQWCIAVDVRGYASKILNGFVHRLRHNKNMYIESYLFVNVATFSLKSRQNEHLFKQAFSKACENIPQFHAYVGNASITGKSFEAPVSHQSFKDLVEKIKENLENESEYFISCHPHVKFATVSKEQNFTREIPNCNIPIGSLYLWQFGGGYQRPKYIRLPQRERHAGGGKDGQEHGSHLEKMIERNGRLSYNPQWEFTVSKRLSAILRHNSMGFEVDQSGYLEVNKMLHHPFFKRLEVVEGDIEFIVKNNAKKRFALHGEPGNYKIRANQGHTVDVSELSLQEISEPERFPTVVHGTNMEAWRLISRKGLNKMKRNHIHMTTALPHSHQVISGMRNSSDCFIFIDIKKAMEDGIKFYLSDNEVILSEGIDGVISPEYFSQVKRRGHNGKDYDVPLKQVQRPKSDQQIDD